MHPFIVYRLSSIALRRAASRPSARRIPCRRALALPEVLICMTIASLMLTATAVAFNASVHSYRDNQERNHLLSSGRIALRQIVADIRIADAHSPVNDTVQPTATSLFASGTTTENGGIQLIFNRPSPAYASVSAANPATWIYVTYSFNAATRTIDATRKVGTQPATTSTLAHFVQDFRVRLEPARSAANVYAGVTTYDILLRGVVNISLQNKNADGTAVLDQGNRALTVRLTDAAMPRKSFASL